MLTASEQKRIIAGIQVSAMEATGLDDVATRILPQLDRLFDTSNSIFYRRDEYGFLMGIGGRMVETMSDYAPYYPEDPLQPVFNHLNPKMMAASTCEAWKLYLKRPVYTHCLRHHGICDFLNLRFTPTTHVEPGMVGMLLARSEGQRSFQKREQKIMEGLLPTLEAVVSRSLRLEERLEFQGMVEGVLEQFRRPVIVLSTEGMPLWFSKRADTLLGITRGGRKILPEALVAAARRLGRLLKRSAGPSRVLPVVTFPDQSGRPIRSELRLGRSSRGTHLVIAELDDFEYAPFLNEAAKCFRLTAAEQKVLGLISIGLSNREISQRLFVSAATVHTHVARILDKLKVRSRVQAALIAHGHSPEICEAE